MRLAKRLAASGRPGRCSICLADDYVIVSHLISNFDVHWHVDVDPTCGMDHVPPLRALLAPTDLPAAQISGALDAAFASDAEIYLNHALVDRETFREYVSGERAAGGHGRTEVECKSEDLTETEADGASIVAGKMTLVHTHNFRIRAAPARNSTVIVFSAKIRKSPTPQIVQLFQTSVDKPFQINLPTVRQPPVDAGAL
ncbi:hypothetical protein B0H10DRAFT_2237735 [Mycena sp. CBHHK59/15]|nr:hypothetical protein B0H10DRAFT_2237735 [Mycena sp. CBHHK59/15]